MLEVYLTPELLSISHVGSTGDVSLSLTATVVSDIDLKVYPSGEPDLRRPSRTHYFDAPQTAESLIAWETERRARVDEKTATFQPQYEELRKKYEEKRDAEKAEKERIQRLEVTERKAAREKLEAEKRAWVVGRGSDYLKDAVALDYDCQRLYVTERSTAEFPDFVLDFDDNAEWGSRACPSVEALSEVKLLVASGLDARVVWLTSPATKVEEDDDEFEAIEAVVIRDYLGKYDLIKVIG